MSLPPTTILIKRKKNEDPVEALYIHQHKKRRPGHVYKRQNDEESEPKFLTSPTDVPQVDNSRKTKRAVSHQQRLGVKPTVQVSQPGDELRSHISSRLSSTTNTTWEDGAQSGTSTSDTKSETSPHQSQPRRFHLARTSTPDSPHSPAGITKKAQKGPIPMFLERTKANHTRRRSTVTRPLTDSQISQIQAMSRSNDRKLKRPGAASRVPSSALRRAATPETTQPPPPPGQEPPMKFPETNAWNVGSDELAAQMHAFTMQEIGRNLAASAASSQSTSQSQSPVPSPAKSPGASRFRPKLPAQRYHERHPSGERFGRDESGAEADGETSMDVDEDSEDDYVIDTYIRMVGEEPKEGTANFGLLVLDERADVAEFYGEEGESDSEEDEGDEDENAENHHSTDYPDEELGSDDEMGQNLYQYRNHNASDEEEWGEEDAFSDDENEATLHPWQKKPWLNRVRPGEGEWDDSDDSM